MSIVKLFIAADDVAIASVVPSPSQSGGLPGGRIVAWSLRRKHRSRVRHFDAHRRRPADNLPRVLALR